MKIIKINLLLALIGIAFLNSCKTDSPVEAPNRSSFQLLQSKVIAPMCVSCHTTGTNYALESGLILDASAAYRNLVGIPAHHANAIRDRLLRIKPGSADSSFFYMKIHHLPAEKAYGNPMPLGYQPLSIGQQEFIRQWIDAGAPETGTVADPALLDDTTHYPETPFVPLDPPDAGEGFQIGVGPFTVRPNFEREIFIYKKLPVTEPIYSNHLHLKMRGNSHHFVLYSFDSGTKNLPPFDVIRDLRDSTGNENLDLEIQMLSHVFLGGAMDAEVDYYLPKGIAIKLDPSAGIDMNLHYVNKTSQPILGEAYANIYTMDPSEVQHVAKPIMSYSLDFSLPPHEETTVTNNTFTNTSVKQMNVILLTSHNHAKGKKFKIQRVGGVHDGEFVYESDDWEHPVIKQFDPPLVLKKGEGLKSIVTYYNDTPNDIGFGFKSTDEMNVIFGQYYE